MHTGNENSFGYIYGILLLLFFVMAVVFLLCDFKALPEKYCSCVNDTVNKITAKVNGL